MTFRITSITGDDGDTLLIADNLVAGGLDEVVHRAVNAVNRPLTIDVGDLQHTDTAALCFVARLEADGVRLTRVSRT